MELPPAAPAAPRRWSQDATAGTITINQVLLPGVGYLQSLYEGSEFAPSCWLRVRTGDTFLRLPPSVAAVLDAQALGTATDSTNGTLLLTDVLGAIGFQKMATRHADDLFGARVEVWLRITNGVVTGWAVTSEALSSALDAAGISSEWGQDLIDFIQQFDDAQWGVDYGGLGVPSRSRPRRRSRSSSRARSAAPADDRLTLGSVLAVLALGIVEDARAPGLGDDRAHLGERAAALVDEVVALGREGKPQVPPGAVARARWRAGLSRVSSSSVRWWLTTRASSSTATSNAWVPVPWTSSTASSAS